MAQLSSTVAVALLSVTLGYWLGVGSKFNFSRGAEPALAVDEEPLEQAEKQAAPPAPVDPKPAAVPAAADGALEVDAEDDSEDGSSDDDDDESEDGFVDGLDKIQAEGLEPCKMVLIVRTDLGMTKGKIAAQCCHAAVACYKIMSASNVPLLRHWEYTGQAKIALQCKSEEDLLLLEATAQSLNLCAKSICDAGRTQIAAGSRTVLAIGPAPVRLINEVTGHLKLL